MSRRFILSAAEHDSLLALPDTQDELIRHYTLSKLPMLAVVERACAEAISRGLCSSSTCLRSAGNTST